MIFAVKIDDRPGSKSYDDPDYFGPFGTREEAEQYRDKVNKTLRNTSLVASVIEVKPPEEYP